MILVVDDHTDTRLVIMRLLRIDGYDAVGCADGKEALTYLQANVPTLVFTDYSMPDMDGIDIVREMKKDQRLAAVPILMFTAHDDDDRREKAKSAGVDAYIVKGRLDWAPIRLELLRLIGPGKPPMRQPPSQNENHLDNHRKSL